MKGIRNLHTGWLMLSCLSVFSFQFTTLYAQDFDRLSERQVMGTARYVGMSGAMTAIGGDPSAVSDNPAGLGVYRRSEVLITADWQRDRTRQDKSDSVPRTTDLFMVPQVSFVVAIGDPDKDRGVISNNLMFSYSRQRSYSRDQELFAGSDRSLGEMLGSEGINLGMNIGTKYPTSAYNTFSAFRLRESGYVNQYGLDWAINISHRLYIGAGLRMYSYRFAADIDYYEQFAQLSADGKPYDLENENSFILKGIGVGGSFGLIYRPCGWVRLGASFHTPTANTVHYNSAAVMSSQTDSLRYSNTSDGDEKWTDYHAPLRASFGAALQVGDYGVLSFQYDYRHASYTDDLHTLRTGLEVVPVPGLYLNAGYGYESTFSKSYTVVPMDPAYKRRDTHTLRPLTTQYASGGIGYRGQMFMAQLAYQYRWQRLRSYAYETAQPIDINADTHRVVLTIGWHN